MYDTSSFNLVSQYFSDDGVVTILILRQKHKSFPSYSTMYVNLNEGTSELLDMEVREDYAEYSADLHIESYNRRNKK